MICMLKIQRLLIALIIAAITLCYSTPKVMAAQDIEKKVANLEGKVSKKFSKTFCNSTGFGISNEGALKFAIGETNGEFSKNPLLEKVDLDALKDHILIDVADTCYYFELTKNDLNALTLKKEGSLKK